MICLRHIVWLTLCFNGLNSSSDDYSFMKKYDSTYSSVDYSPVRPHIPPVKVQPAAYGLVQLPYAHVTRAPPNPAATEYPYDGGINTQTNTTASPTACRSTTYRTNLNCPCLLIGQPCFPANSRCLAQSNSSLGGFCGCAPGYVPFNLTCVTTAFYNQNVSQNFTLLAPVLTASCFLPVNAPFGNIPEVGANGSVTYTLQLLTSSPTNVSTSYITIESSTGNLLFLSAPPVNTVTSQTYSVFGTDSTGVTSNILTFTARRYPFVKFEQIVVLYQCTAPTVSFDLGNNFIVDCTRVSVGDVIVTAIASNTVAPTTFTMTLVSSTSTLGNTYYAIDPTNGQIFLQNEPHGGIFIEVYNVYATNAVGQVSAPQTLTLTTSATCT